MLTHGTVEGAGVMQRSKWSWDLGALGSGGRTWVSRGVAQVFTGFGGRAECRGVCEQESKWRGTRVGRRVMEVGG